MPRDDWKPKRVAEKVRAMLPERALLPDEQEMRRMDEERRRDVALDIVNNRATFGELNGATVAWLENDPEGLNREALDTLGFNFRRSRENPVQASGDDIYVDAKALLSRCQRVGVDCTALAAELNITLPAVSVGSDKTV